MKSLTQFGFVLLVVFFALISSTNGQACGRYYITVSVQTLDGKPIKTARVDLKVIDTDETKGKNFVRDKADPSVFSIDYFEGHSFRSFHKVTISAPGFISTENLTKFTSCENRGVVVKLAKAGSSSPAVWSFQNNVNVKAVGSDGKPVEGVTLTVIDGHNKPETVDMKFGFAYFTVPSGEYTFRFEARGYQTKNERVDLTKLARQSVKVELVRQETSVLTGRIYDAQGYFVPDVKIVAVSSEGKRFETVANDEGVYVLILPFNKYPGLGTFKEAQFDLIVEPWKGFLRSETKGFVFVPSQLGKMYLDIALRAPPPIFD